MCYGTPDQIRQRFNWERGYCEEAWRRNPNVKCAIGTFSHGTPNYIDAGCVQALKETYVAFAQAYPDKVAIDYHTYTHGRRRLTHPPPNAEIVDPVWFETRPHETQKACGMSTKVAWMSGEGGVEAGQGGMAWAGYTPQQFAEWCSDILGLWRDYPPLGMAFFKYGWRSDWQGYDMAAYIDALTQMWRGPAPQMAATQSMEAQAYDVQDMRYAYAPGEAKNIGN
jgi:hypothetical protein